MEIDTAALTPIVRRALVDLATDIRLARNEVRVGRVAPVDHTSLLAARQELLRVMEVYADELTVRRLPIPHKLHDELRLMRAIKRLPQSSGWNRHA